jgi:integrase
MRPEEMRRPKRASFGTVKELPSGKFLARYTVEGERLSAGTFDTDRKARAALAAVQTDIERHEWTDARKGRILFSALADDVMEQARATLRPGTVRNYESLLRTALAPFTSKPLDSITIRSVDLWWARNRAHPVNRRNAYFVLSKIMNHAVRYGYLKASPCRVEKAGKDVAVPRPTHTYSELLRLVEAMPSELRPVIWVMFAAHLRCGEVCGLNRGDYDTKSGMLRVERQVTEIGGAHLSDTKTGNRKTIRLLQPGVDALATYLAKNPQLPTAPLFTGPKGNRISRGYIRTHWLRALEATGIENFHEHDIRHVGLTLVAQAGATTREVMTRGGHTSATTALRYQHSSAERDAVIASKADALLNASERTN